jgi:site-specific DNA-methyltransferase (adenine-specific)
MNQKPLRLIQMILVMSSDPGDVVWEPFGGLCSVGIAAYRLGRRCHSAEMLRNYYRTACERLSAEHGNGVGGGRRGSPFAMSGTGTE